MKEENARERLPYDLRLRIGKALDGVICQDSTPEQVDQFVAMFRDFGLTISETHGVIHHDIINRYDGMLSVFTQIVECRQQPGTEPCHLRWMLRELSSFTDAGKAGRWLGFVQGLLIERGLTTVQTERDFTRPYFA